MESWVSMKNKITNICVVVTIIMIIVSQIYYAWGDYQEAASEKEKINLWHPLTGGDGEYFQEVVNKFNRQSEEYYIDVSVFKWDEYNAKLANAIAAGEGPDIQLTRNSFYSYLRTKNMIVDITDISQKVGIPWESYNPSALSIVKEEDRYFGVPIDTHPEVMYYNKDILNKAGVLDNSGQPEFVKSEEGFLEFLDKIAKSMPEGEYPIALPTYSKSAEQWYLWYTWYVYNGGKGLFNSEYTKAKIDKEAFTISADMEKKLFQEPYILPNDTDFTQTFASGRAAICFTGVWAVEKFRESIPELGAVEIPNLWNQEQIAYGGSHILSISRNVNPIKQKGCVEFIKYFNKNGIEWAKAGHVPVNMKVWELEEYKEMPFRLKFTEIAQKVSYVEPYKDIFSIYENTISPNLEMIWRNSISIDKSYQKIIRDINYELEY